MHRYGLSLGGNCGFFEHWRGLAHGKKGVVHLSWPWATCQDAGTGHAHVHVFGARHTRVCIGTGRVSVGIVALSSIGGDLLTEKTERCICLGHGNHDCTWAPVMPTCTCSVPDTLVFASVRAESRWELWLFRALEENWSRKKRSSAFALAKGNLTGRGHRSCPRARVGC